MSDIDREYMESVVQAAKDGKLAITRVPLEVPMSDKELDGITERLYLSTHPTREQIRAALAEAMAARDKEWMTTSPALQRFMAEAISGEWKWLGRVLDRIESNDTHGTAHAFCSMMRSALDARPAILRAAIRSSAPR